MTTPKKPKQSTIVKRALDKLRQNVAALDTVVGPDHERDPTPKVLSTVEFIAEFHRRQLAAEQALITESHYTHGWVNPRVTLAIMEQEGIRMNVDDDIASDTWPTRLLDRLLSWRYPPP
jgi:hypothetical protein